MGAGASKQGDASKQIFLSENPVQFSQELIDSLQASSETNSTRAKSLDLHIQQRVAAELEKLAGEKESKLEAARQKILSGDSKNKSEEHERTSGAVKLPKISPQDLFKKETEQEKARKNASSQKVQEEIQKLQKALGERKVLKDLPKEVTDARDEVVSCLRLNDRQSLNCWKEVEIFKREVRKMEEQFVGKVL
ncbi:hypothetical protein LTR64_007309 [Lithohypha guttulata]|uniref:uncharacterized protein n=1 Tax=Lithohypha guttulata TaxID=1690604 RepID=UPI00315CC2C4